MNRDVLVISASPKEGGNSNTLCDEFICEAQEFGNHAERIFLASKNIKYYIGCGVYSTTQKCVQKDDMVGMLDKVAEADVIISATPVYFYTMGTRMGVLIDRTVPRRTEIQNKDFCFIVTAVDMRWKMMERTIEEFRGFTQDCLTGTRKKGIIYGTDAWQAGEIEGTPAMKQAYEVGRSIWLKNKMHDGPEDTSCIFCVLQL